MMRTVVFRVLTGAAVAACATLSAPATAAPSHAASAVAAAVTPGLMGDIYYSRTGTTAEQSGIYRMEADGNQPTPIAPFAPGDVLLPEHAAVSSDGQRIVYRTVVDLWLINADGTGKVQLTHTGLDISESGPAFSPDGRYVTYSSDPGGNSDIYRRDLVTGRVVRLTTSTGADYDAAFSPDGKSIVFVSTRNGSPNPEIYRMNVDGTNQTRLTNIGGNDTDPEYSPNGGQIVFTTDRIGAGNFEIFRMNTDGTGQTRLTINTSNDTDPTYSPDGGQIAFVSNRDGSSQIYRMNGNGTGQFRLTSLDGSSSTGPAWAPAYTECQGLPATITGTSGDDTLVGTPGPDVIAGLAGDDTLQGFDGADVFCGGPGTDTVTYADHELDVTANLGGGAGDDGSAEDGPLGARDSIAKDVENLVGGLSNDDLTGSSVFNNLTGGPGDDHLSGGADGDNLLGGSGDDVLIGGDGGEALLGGSGDDVLIGGDGNEFLIAGESGDDILRGGDGVDALTGNAGDDELYGGDHGDFLEGGLDSDVIDGGPGVDTTSYDGRVSGVVASIGGGVGDDGSKQDGPTGERDTIANNVENLIGGLANDTLTGNADDNQLTGGLGADTLLGLGGTDLLKALDGVKDTKLDCGDGPDFPAERDRVGVVDPSAASCTGASLD
ncbi:hypothetical protein F0U44_03605 [Nocardioides humilatus]|uniref:DUF5050 domain-containing protein n=1 Tax=Nocardioides humilatus TaxID=2607660 RepID=A0A5B1LLS1_9ACTN|nr:PD40 domain-containing protein [Nocardioides humilatus]KAA1421396.1 hypothetical protein F0U44_03605 [Nocardioides humilatus]